MHYQIATLMGYLGESLDQSYEWTTAYFSSALSEVQHTPKINVDGLSYPRE